ncbi:MAG TPA: SLBB domain-containing protein [Abditibacteriaceae bacterium]|nr:SLBB domain-containing protein [Abditibacteriaceae bacterium]
MLKPTRRLHAMLIRTMLTVLVCLPALAPRAPARAAEEYRLGPDDVIQVIVARHPAFSVDLIKIPSSGKIQLPVVESIFVAGMTIPQLDKALTKKFEERLKRPEVTVLLREPRQQQIFLVGAIVKPGPYDIKGGWRVSDALAAAGGPIARPEMVQATLDRKGQKPVAVDLPAIMKDTANRTNVIVKAGDTLRLEMRNIPITVAGKVVQPGRVDVPKGSTVVVAVAAANGLAPGADKTKVTVQRTGGKTFTVDLYKVMEGGEAARDVKLEAGDLITVPESNNRVTLTGAGVNRPGTYEMTPGVPVKISEALALAGGYTPRAALTQATVRHVDGTITQVNLYNVMRLDNQQENIEVRAGDLIMVPESQVRVTVQGAVLKPGPYYIPDGEKLLVADVVALAGGPTPQAALTKATVRRVGGQTLPIDLYKVTVLGLADDNIELAPEDIVTLPEAKGVTVLGAVAKPSIYYLEAGRAPRVADALAAAGGLTVPATEARISILRNVASGTPQVLKIHAAGLLGDDEAQNAPVQDGDAINVVEIKPQTIYVTGQVRQAGPYELKEGEGIPELLARAGGTTNFAALRSVTVKHGNETKVIDVFDAIKNNKPLNFVLHDRDSVMVPKNEAQVLVMPAVKNPDYYPIPEDRPLTVAQALALAGGPLTDAKIKEIAILRQTPTGVQTTIIPLNKTKGNQLALNQTLQNGDVVYVPPGTTTPSTWDKVKGVISGLGPIGLLLGGI